MLSPENKITPNNKKIFFPVKHFPIKSSYQLLVTNNSTYVYGIRLDKCKAVLGWIESFLPEPRHTRTANEGPVKILCKCRVSIYVYPEIKLLFAKQNYNVLSPSSDIHISVRDWYISRICLPILLQGNMWTNPGNI